MKHLMIKSVIAGALFSLPALTNVTVFGHHFGAVAHSTQATTKVPAMRDRVYTQLARAQKLSENGDKTAGFEVLDQVKDNIDSLNSYEKAMLWNFYGFMYYGQEDIANTISSFENVVAQEAIPDTLRVATLYSLAQLAMQSQDYAKSLEFLNQWQVANNKPLVANQHILFAQVYYQNKQFNESIKHITSAVDMAEASNELPKEHWLILQRAAYYELKQPENVTKVIEKLVKLYEKPQYWLQLAGMYGEIGQEQKQLGAMETAWQAGYITKPGDIVMLAQLYLYQQLPFKAAKVLDDAIASGKVVPEEKHYQLISQAYIQAREDQKAIPVLKKAAEIAEHGKFDAQLAQTYLNTENWQQAINYSNKAIARGDLDNQGNMLLVLGMAHFNLQQFDQSLTAFEQAKGIKSSAKTASQWHKYVQKEQGYQEKLAMLNE
ncbi:hypothetical protein LP316_14125 [Thalassotalea sp. LPB0316]|uniref:tetratricopeptide repeat protein n=1 Tax=Thalassotalea sp. LPB0316 TaxID=2769490 RepID=UPI00186776A8|nr:tetratricopeptide repeat protein [Thalassotalea sp. LPB0316]QOL25416.1 hypothetical protein LP316_14125 [Thalassotalea sp. LPB0316]